MKSLAEMAKERGLNYKTVWSRIQLLGWPISKALQLPPAPVGKYGKYRKTPGVM